MLTTLLMDIEGTTTPISFVHDTLFPYARRALPAWLAAHWDDPAVRAAAASMGAGDSAADAWARCEALMDADVKDTGLKALQGMVWREGFEAGELHGEVFPDVPPALSDLRARGVTLAIYSSGSIEAQRLLFGYNRAGDLAAWMSGFFDTTTGPKKAAASYTAIAAALGKPPASVLFVSDHPDEIAAAAAAGLRVTALARPGNAPLPPDFTWPVAPDFAFLGALDWAS